MVVRVFQEKIAPLLAPTLVMPLLLVVPRYQHVITSINVCTCLVAAGSITSVVSPVLSTPVTQQYSAARPPHVPGDVCQFCRADLP